MARDYLWHGIRQRLNRRHRNRQLVEPLESRRLLAGVVLAADLDLRTESAFPDTGHQTVVAGDFSYAGPLAGLPLGSPCST